MTKAQQLRNKQLGESLKYKLTSKLRRFKDLYLGDYADYQESKIKNQINWRRNLAENPKALRDYNNEKQANLPQTFVRFDEVTVEGLLIAIKNLENKLSFNNSNRFEWMSEANDSYKLKFDRLIDKLVGFQINNYKLRIETIGAGTSGDFGFLISDDDIEVHARIIYACGEIKAPHYRFIVTGRKK